MKRRGFLTTALAAASMTTSPLLMGIPAEANLVKCGDLKAIIGEDGTPVRIQSGSGGSLRVWLANAPTLSVTNEVTGITR